ncbi:FAD-dependent oxidoreductase [Halanaerobiaceae bacterium Z-7014]|uniref:FAD-dependent oxidoreductase n=1 Tax=Halonatronomonas betaini TaxID=2778430 RepID=A0A931ARL4_9FIRM|nr:FAD-dependent oxidoreductase [Halonatronomonas betaini]MBF8436834.1 FAD-dependent oxidoreductase [Halonatronomonas betaini]
MKRLFISGIVIFIILIGTLLYINLAVIDTDSYYEADINPDFDLEEIDKNFTDKYNLIVTGSEPESIAAAVAGARNGQKVLLVSTDKRPGGLMVKGKLNTIDMNYNPDGKILNQGIFKEVYNQLEGTSFNTETAENVFTEMIGAEENITYIDSAEKFEPVFNNEQLVGLEVFKNDNVDKYYGDNFIDGTADADFAREAGVNYSVGMEDIGRPDEYQVATQVFELENVDWDETRDYLNNDGDPNTGGDQRSLWGFSSEMGRYEPESDDLDVRGLNVGRQEDDRVLINSIHLFDVDPLDNESIERAKELAADELPSIVKHINNEIPGFSEASLTKKAEELYIRESIHTESLYTLNINDVREHKDFQDKIALASYPVDIQRTSRDNQGFVYNNPKKYSIPFRSIVPDQFENLLVVGRSAGFDSLAHGSARVIPTGMATAEAAGVASRIAIEEDVGFDEIAESDIKISEMQTRLKNQGNYLDDFEYEFAGQDSKALDGIRFINSLGLLIGGYENQFDFEEKLETDQFLNRLNQASVRYFKINENNNKLDVELNDLELEGLLDQSNLNKIYGEIFLSDTEDLDGDEILKSEFIDNQFLEYIETGDYISREIGYQLIKEIILKVDSID